MKIQVISLAKGEKWGGGYDYTYTTFSAPNSFDAYDLNIIDLQEENIWRYRGTSASTIDDINDFRSLKTNLQNAKKSKIIVCFPQNYDYTYNFSYTTYPQTKHLKDMLDLLTRNILIELLPNCMKSKTYDSFAPAYKLVYENSETKCNDTSFKAAFYFSDYPASTVITRCEGSGKATTLLVDNNYIFTTLNLNEKKKDIKDFFLRIGLEREKSEYPAWLSDYYFADDAVQREKIGAASEKIRGLNAEIESAKGRIQENLKYKSVLVTNAKELVETVFEMLEKMLACDLTQFKDEFKEDFLIKLPTVTFVGEIKGVTSNIKSEHVSQLDVHYNTYLDKLSEEGNKENVKALLIINPFRDRPLSERDEIHETQKKLAERNGSLIITTETFLKIYGKFLKNELSTAQVIDIFDKKKGFLILE